MMSREIEAGVLILACALVACVGGCHSRTGNPRHVERLTPYDRAELTVLFDSNESVRGRTYPVRGDDLEELLRFFPGLGSVRRSKGGGLWDGKLQIDFIRPDGTQSRVYVDEEFERWTDEDGDVILRPGLRTLINRITQNPAP